MLSVALIIYNYNIVWAEAIELMNTANNKCTWVGASIDTVAAEVRAIRI